MAERTDFLAFVQRMDMSASYKPVMLICLLDEVGSDGTCSLIKLIQRFHRYYLEREDSGKPVELRQCRMRRAAVMKEHQVRSLVLGMPFEKYERRGFLWHEPLTDRAGFDPALWKTLSSLDLTSVRQMAESAVQEYYSRGSRIDG